MAPRWRMLALLFSVRVTMAFQFQAVAALSPFLMDRYGVGLADIGLLIGLYLSPGIVAALPGGAIGRRFGDKPVVAAGLALMLVGGVMAATLSSWEAQVVARLIAGLGGVMLNVLMAKMVTEWFAGRELATAMGIFVNSWPVGIALALLVLPPLAERGGLETAWVAICASIGLGLATLVRFYRSPPGAAASAAAGTAPLRGAALAGLLFAASIWGLYNAALAMIFGFGPAMLVERGWSAPAASSITSIALWIVAVSVPLGGFIADRIGRRDLVLAAGLASFAVLMLLAPGIEATIPLFVALGCVGGIAAGPVMSLPNDVLGAGNRAFGMGLFFAVYYGAIFLAPATAGVLSDATGSAEAAFLFGGAMLIGCLALLAAFKAASRGAKRIPAPSARRRHRRRPSSREAP